MGQAGRWAARKCGPSDHRKSAWMGGQDRLSHRERDPKKLAILAGCGEPVVDHGRSTGGLGVVEALLGQCRCWHALWLFPLLSPRSLWCVAWVGSKSPEGSPSKQPGTRFGRSLDRGSPSPTHVFPPMQLPSPPAQSSLPACPGQRLAVQQHVQILSRGLPTELQAPGQATPQGCCQLVLAGHEN